MLRYSLRILLVVFFAHLGVRAVGQGVVSSGTHYRDSLYQHISRDNTARLSCYFTYATGSSVIHADLGHNGIELSRLDSFIRHSTTHPDFHIKHIRLTGYSSIEGRYSENEKLSRERITGFYHYLRDHYPELYRYPYDMAWVAEDWKLLSTLVRESGLNEQDEILEIIRRVHTFDDRESLLKKLNGGGVYEEISRTILPRLRRVEIEIEYSLTPILFAEGTPKKREADPLIYNVLKENRPNNWYSHRERPAETLQSLTLNTHPSTPLVDEETKKTAKTREKVGAKDPSARFALKTNLLLWSGVLPNAKHQTPVANAALEYYITPHWSVEAGAAYSYWHYDNRNNFQGLSGYRLEGRYRTRFLHDNLTGFLGLYGRVGDYDLRHAANHTGKYWDAGLSGGLTFRLVGNLGMEVGGRLGYLNTTPVEYKIDGNTNWFFTHADACRKIRLTGLNVSLMYRFK